MLRKERNKKRKSEVWFEREKEKEKEQWQQI